MAKDGDYHYEFIADRGEGHQWRVANENDDVITDFGSEAAARDHVERHNRRLTGEILPGLEVQLMPSPKAATGLRDHLTRAGRTIGTIIGVTSLGVCTVRLTPGTMIPGYSHPLDDDGEYIDLHREHLVYA